MTASYAGSESVSVHNN